MQVTEDVHNELFSRREVVVKMAVEGTTPSRQEVLKALQSHFTVAADEIVIDKVEHPFGSKFVRIHAKLYSKAADAKSEPKYKAERGMAKEKKAEEGK